MGGTGFQMSYQESHTEVFFVKIWRSENKPHKHREAYLGRRNGQCKGPEACAPAELEGKRWEMRTDDNRGRRAVWGKCLVNQRSLVFEWEEEVNGDCGFADNHMQDMRGSVCLSRQNRNFRRVGVSLLSAKRCDSESVLPIIWSIRRPAAGQCGVHRSEQA